MRCAECGSVEFEGSLCRHCRTPRGQEKPKVITPTPGVKPSARRIKRPTKCPVCEKGHIRYCGRRERFLCLNGKCKYEWAAN